ncbi:MAG: 3-dehydroquinate synthase [Bacteroidales bacterium]
MEHQIILFTNEINEAINKIATEIAHNKLFILTDSNTKKYVLPLIADNEYVKGANMITIEVGDANKNLNSTVAIWSKLQEYGATRKSLMLNLGGGVVTDIGGFAASTFKRGMKFVNIPTTLLAAVDAAIGGKTGINFGGLKNEIGVFNEAEAVIISTAFLKTLPIEEIKSGYAEMLKHGLLSSELTDYNKLLDFDFSTPDYNQLLQLLKESVEVKRMVVTEDPFEHGIRRALNLGHTVGHSFESLSMKRGNPLSHGYAVAWGLVVELTISKMELGFDSNTLYTLGEYVRQNYGVINITCDDYDALIEYMRHDKKSNNGELNFSLLNAIGDIKIDCEVSAERVKAALDIFRDILHI